MGPTCWPLTRLPITPASSLSDVARHRMLFPGDAEVRSWQEMNKRLHFRRWIFSKVSHHAPDQGCRRLDLASSLPVGAGIASRNLDLPAADAAGGPVCLQPGAQPRMSWRAGRGGPSCTRSLARRRRVCGFELRGDVAIYRWSHR